MNPENEIFENHHDNQTKKGRGGKRLNSGRKSSGIEAITVRIDKRLLNTIMEIKARFKNGNFNLDDLFAKPAPKNDDVKLLQKIAKLEREKESMRDGFFKLLQSRDEDHDQEISTLKAEIHSLKVSLIAEQAMTELIIGQRNNSGLDEKLRKRLIQFCHPDKHQDEKTKGIAGELVQALNGLGK